MSFPTWISVVFAGCLVVLSGLFSGLTLGLLGLDLYGLEIAMANDNETTRKHAAAILPIRKRGNLLLCTLLLGNVMVNVALPILIESISSGTISFVLSTIIIVIFGEILPQALCSRHALRVGSAAVPIVQFLIAVFFVASYPISRILDYFLGRELGTIYDKKELGKLIEIHQRETLQKGEANIMSGALKFGEKKVVEIMTPIDKSFMLDIESKLDFELLSAIFKSGFSRIPVYDGSANLAKIVGMIFVKDLILVDPDDCLPIKTVLNFYGRSVNYVFDDCPLHVVFRDFKSGLFHMAIVQTIVNDGPGDPYYENVGIVTLEDVIEVILQEDIVDETDLYVSTKDLRPARHGIDVTKLTVFNHRYQGSARLSDDEQKAIFFHLRGTIPLFTHLDTAVLANIVSKSSLITVQIDEGVENRMVPFEQRSKNKLELQERRQKDVSEGGLSLYQLNQSSEYFTLVLDCRVEVVSGRNKFRSDIGRWQVMGLDLLEMLLNPETKNEEFLPDFSAYVTKSGRILRFSRELIVQAIASESGLASTVKSDSDQPVDTSVVEMEPVLPPNKRDP